MTLFLALYAGVAWGLFFYAQWRRVKDHRHFVARFQKVEPHIKRLSAENEAYQHILAQIGVEIEIIHGEGAMHFTAKSGIPFDELKTKALTITH